MAKLTLTIRTDTDYLRMLAYREVLRDIAASVDPWGNAGSFARDVLRQFGDLPDTPTDSISTEPSNTP